MEINYFKSVSLGLFFLFAYTLIPIGVSYAQFSGQTLAQTTFPPPIFYSIRAEPSYVIRIPFNDLGNTTYAPRVASLPIGMTVIWFNDDSSLHTVTTTINSPETFDSGPILPGGSYTHRFTHTGIYNYFDTFSISTPGRIRVGNAMEVGNNFNMMIGGNNAIPFNATKHLRVELSFIPKTVPIPPTVAVTYNVTLLNANGSKLYSHNYDDTDGILDMELIPATTIVQNQSGSAQTNATSAAPNQYTTWGPDFIGQLGHGSTGTFHIQGPVLLQDQVYYIYAAIITKDSATLSPPASDIFFLPPVSANLTALAAQQTNSPVHSTVQAPATTNGFLQNATLTK